MKQIVFLFALFLLIACKSNKQAPVNPNVKVDFTKLEKPKSPIDNKEETPQKVVAEKKTTNCFDKATYEANKANKCDETVSWVCGCNSISYINECVAKKSGIKSYKRGKCPVEASDI
jgi:hypothetical protein